MKTEVDALIANIRESVRTNGAPARALCLATVALMQISLGVNVHGDALRRHELRALADEALASLTAICQEVVSP
jgi:hypothetical protein